MLFQHVMLILAAFAGGLLNAVAGGGTLLTYPFLLLAGSSSIVANATSTVVLWPGVIASLPAYRKEIFASRRWIKKLLLPAFIGGIFGAYILTHTTDGAFTLIAPFLIILGSLILHYQLPIDRFFHHIQLAHPHQRIFFIAVIVFGIGIYGAYFGAGIGILLLGGLSILGIKNIYREIAIKNVLVVVVNLTAVIYFIDHHLINWQFVPMMVGASVLGGITGPHIVRHLDKARLKNGVVLLGIALAVILLIIRLV